MERNDWQGEVVDRRIAEHISEIQHRIMPIRVLTGTSTQSQLRSVRAFRSLEDPARRAQIPAHVQLQKRRGEGGDHAPKWLPTGPEGIQVVKQL
jgi:hypothetical protein